ncbi:MAG TPA: hypothetical protein VML75_14890 [Kofleriaceae bacterium]|nr:hypothetical protein [Kofleriaceae bacterium]
MDIAKLFGVLVVGGALLVGCDGESEPAPADANGVSASGMADAAADTGVAATPDAAPTTGLQECGFCPNEACCVVDDEGVSSVKDGFECCWGTTC